MRTMREAHEFIKAHLIEQGGRSLKNDSYCAYLAPNGRRCAVGCLLSPTTAEKWDSAGDTSIQSILEKIGVNRVIEEVKIIGEQTIIIDFLVSWQMAHDQYRNITNDRWEEYIEVHANMIADKFFIGTNSNE